MDLEQHTARGRFAVPGCHTGISLNKQCSSFIFGFDLGIVAVYIPQADEDHRKIVRIQAPFIQESLHFRESEGGFRAADDAAGNAQIIGFQNHVFRTAEGGAYGIDFIEAVSSDADHAQGRGVVKAAFDTDIILLLLSFAAGFEIVQYPFEIPLERCFLFFGKTFEKDGIHIIGDPAVACLH